MDKSIAGSQEYESPGLDPTPQGLPTTQLQDDWRDILHRLNTTHEADIWLASEYAMAWTNALLRAHVIDMPTYETLSDARVQARDAAWSRIAAKEVE
jgi:hypothetical protein